MFKVGDRVFCKEHRKFGYIGEIAELKSYPITVVFDDMSFDCYTSNYTLSLTSLVSDLMTEEEGVQYMNVLRKEPQLDLYTQHPDPKRDELLRVATKLAAARLSDDVRSDMLSAESIVDCAQRLIDEVDKRFK